MDGAKVPGLADAHINGDEAWSLSEVAWDQCLSGSRSQIKVAKRCAHDVCCGVVAIHTSRSERRTFGEQTIAIRVLPGRDVEGRTGTGNDERIQAHLPPGQIDRARES